MINTSIIGLGKIGFKYDLENKKNIKNHFTALTKHKNFKLFSVHDLKKKKLKNIKKNHNLQILTNIEKSFFKEKNIKLVIVSVSTKNHFDVLKDVINRIKPKAILCEKPFTGKYTLSKKILSLSKKKKIRIFVNYIRISDPNYLKIQKILKNKNLYFRIKVYFSNGVLNNASHYINFLSFCFNNKYKIDKVEKFKSLKGNDFNANFRLKFTNASIDFFESSTNVNKEMEIEYSNKKILVYKKNGILINKKRLKDTIFRYQYNVLNNLNNYYLNKKFNLCSGKMASKTLLICEKIFKKAYVQKKNKI